MKPSLVFCEQVLPKQLHSPLCLSIFPKIRKSSKFKTPCHGDVSHLQLPRSGLRDSSACSVQALSESALHVRPLRRLSPREWVPRCHSVTKCHHHVAVASCQEHAGVGLFVRCGSCCEPRFAKGQQVSTMIAENGWDE